MPKTMYVSLKQVILSYLENTCKTVKQDWTRPCM